MSENHPWRYATDAEGTITRGRIYRLDSPDEWIHYWDGVSSPAFYDEGFRGRRVVDGLDPVADADAERAIVALAKGGHEALDTLAVRLTGNDEACFVTVALDRGIDLYALSWDSDPDRSWRDEIEAVYNGDVWRIEVEEYMPHVTEHGAWINADDVWDQYYGEANAEAALVEVFPETEFPAERLIENSND